MEKKLSPIWFLRDPIDPEYKEYVLLDYLKSISKDIDTENCFNIVRKISKIVKALNDFKENRKISEALLKHLNKEDKEFLANLYNKTADHNWLSQVNEIIEKSLNTLYDYSEIFLEMIKEEESKIKIFKINSKYDKKPKEKSGILIIRNMVTDKILNYFFKGNIRMKMDDGDREIFILKKVHLKNTFFSLNYEYIYHEILQESNMNDDSFPGLYVIEIYENFEEESEIYKLAKEKFIDAMSK